MRSLGIAAAVALLAATGPGPAQANAYSAAFVDAFAKACAPQRESYDGSLAQARSEGWSPVDVASNDELAAVMGKSDAGLDEARAEGLAMDFRYQAFAREIDGRQLHLLVSYAESDVIDEVGCYLYDFAASEPVDRAAVSGFIGAEPTEVLDDPGIVSAVWAPPASMPRTLDTYLTYIPAGSEHVEAGGFDGVVLKFSTSAPDKGAAN